MLNPLSTIEQFQLSQAVYYCLTKTSTTGRVARFENTEKHLLDLMRAIMSVDGTQNVDWRTDGPGPPPKEFVDALREKFPPDSPLWHFIVLQPKVAKPQRDELSETPPGTPRLATWISSERKPGAGWQGYFMRGDDLRFGRWDEERQFWVDEIINSDYKSKTVEWWLELTLPPLPNCESALWERLVSGQQTRRHRAAHDTHVVAANAWDTFVAQEKQSDADGCTLCAAEQLKTAQTATGEANIATNKAPLNITAYEETSNAILWAAIVRPYSAALAHRRAAKAHLEAAQTK